MNATVLDGEDVDDFDFPQPAAPDAMDLDLSSAAPVNKGAIAERDDRRQTVQSSFGPLRQMKYVEDATPFKSWQIIYPIYIDASKTCEKGRRIPKDKSVKNPVAKDMADAASQLGFSVAYEPEKTHPSDWANPGRVRILYKKDSKLANSSIRTKKQLLLEIAAKMPSVKAITNSARLPEHSPLQMSGLLKNDRAQNPGDAQSGESSSKKKKKKK